MGGKLTDTSPSVKESRICEANGGIFDHLQRLMLNKYVTVSSRMRGKVM